MASIILFILNTINICLQLYHSKYSINQFQWKQIHVIYTDCHRALNYFETILTQNLWRAREEICFTDYHFNLLPGFMLPELNSSDLNRLLYSTTIPAQKSFHE